MRAALEKTVKGIGHFAERSEEAIKTCRFESLNEAYRADAKNYTRRPRRIYAPR